ncbi:copper-transporting ATPase [Amycolatopsis antarctica]|uniref:Copper-transporting ATPase n=1 Tax=Amycolatopsis antarctica TaxID=1854586 RepID=A0A263D459_9PSEU|nr:DUF6541 family protein [Amycolatopsis antarctica]OZM73230.1 copper-transporting ATPase [Amycolatopsis antarctica]
MPTPDTFWIYASTISLYLVVLMVPGLLIGVAAGLRGWVLAGLAPLLTYTAAGLAGPWLFGLGLPYNVGTALAVTILLAGIAGGLRLLSVRRGWVVPRSADDSSHPQVVWSRRAHVVVAACVVLATVLSVIVVLSAAGGTTAVFQRWDTVFHANGIRYIADTGDGSLFGMGSVNWFDEGSFYPNAYHLVAAPVYSLSGASIPVVLNAVTVPVAGIFALCMVAMVRQFGGRAALAGGTAIVAATATTGAYESVSSGLLPFALGIVLTPVAAVVLQRFLQRPGLDTGFLFALAAAGLFASHSSSLVGAILFAVPLLVQRWWRKEGRILPDVARLLAAGAVAGLLVAPHLLATITFSAGSYPYNPWASDIPVTSALGQLLSFHQVLHHPQMWLAALLVIGILAFRSLDRMRWIGASALIMSTLFVAVACYGAHPWVIAMSRPWWNDRYRLMALAAIPLCLLAGHGLAELQRWAARAASNLSWVRSREHLGRVAGVATAVVILAGLAVVTNGFYAKVNATAVAYAYHNYPESENRAIPVSKDEVVAMREVGKLAAPGEMVLNDRYDGTAWVYAISGVRPIAGHYDPSVPPPDATLLGDHFRDYDRDPRVREAVKRLNIRHVLLGSSSIKVEYERPVGLRDLEGMDFLRPVYRNADAVVYEITR